MDARYLEAEFIELQRLVIHECNERADDEGRTAARDAGQLVAEGFSGAGRHDEEYVVALNGCAADGFLIGAEGGESEDAMEQGAKSFVGRRGGHGVSPNDKR